MCTREPDIALSYGLNGLNVWIELDGQQAMEGDSKVIGVSKVFVELWDFSKLQTDMDSFQDLPMGHSYQVFMHSEHRFRGVGSGGLWLSPDGAAAGYIVGRKLCGFQG